MTESWIYKPGCPTWRRRYPRSWPNHSQILRLEFPSLSASLPLLEATPGERLEWLGEISWLQASPASADQYPAWVWSSVQWVEVWICANQRCPWSTFRCPYCFSPHFQPETGSCCFWECDDKINFPDLFHLSRFLRALLGNCSQLQLQNGRITLFCCRFIQNWQSKWLSFAIRTIHLNDNSTCSTLSFNIAIELLVSCDYLTKIPVQVLDILHTIIIDIFTLMKASISPTAGMYSGMNGLNLVSKSMVWGV